MTPWQEDFEKRTQSVIAKSKLKAEIRFRAEVVSPAEWERLDPAEIVCIFLWLRKNHHKS
jgi:hypothetical protein